MHYTSARDDTRQGRFWAGIRLGAGPAAPTFVLGITFGAAAQTAGWGTGPPLAFSLLAFSGSAQFAVLTTLSAGGVLAAIGAATLINARYVVMSVAVNDNLHGGRWWRAVQAQALTDASFVAAHRGHGRFDIARLVGACVPQWTGWGTGTLIGLLVAPPPELMHILGLDVAFPAFFLLLALDELRHSWRATAAALAGAGIAAGLLLVTEPGMALLGSTLAALLGLQPDRKSRQNGG